MIPEPILVPSTAPRDPHLPKSNAKQEKPFEVKRPNSGGWKKAESKLTALAESFDQSISNLKGTSLEASLLIEAELVGSNKSSSKIIDNQNYEIQYQVPADPANTHVIGGRDGVEGAMEDGKWSHSVGEMPTGEALLREWPRQFPKYIAMAISRDEPVFAKVFQVLESSKSGFTVTTETQNLNVGDHEVPFIRVVAISKRDPNRIWEFRFDGARKLPVTIKVAGVNEKGKKENAQWVARWSFSKPIDPATIGKPKFDTAP